jgi:hypothetical protein
VSVANAIEEEELVSRRHVAGDGHHVEVSKVGLVARGDFRGHARAPNMAPARKTRYGADSALARYELPHDDQVVLTVLQDLGANDRYMIEYATEFNRAAVSDDEVAVRVLALGHGGLAEVHSQVIVNSSTSCT